MPVLWLILIVLVIGAVGFVIGRQKALGSAGGDSRELHSLPTYYGSNVFMKVVVPALLLMVVWLVVQPLMIENTISKMIPDSEIDAGSNLGLVMAEVRRAAEGLDNAVAAGAISEDMARNARADFTDMTTRLKDAGQIVTSEITQPILAAAQQYRISTSRGSLLMTIAVIAVALAGLAWAYMQTHKDFRARNVVEQGVLAILISAASIAILTTIGIVLSLIGNTVAFADLYGVGLLVRELGHEEIARIVAADPELAAKLGQDYSDIEFGMEYYSGWARSWAGLADFFTNLDWAPSFSGRGGASSLGIIPLLWGTLYISVVALVVAVPIGLFAAVYLSEYASNRVRSFAKPMLEVLAGIPTIVYGLFALLTIGPILMSVFGDNTVGWMQGQRAVLTAGIAMGIMLIPFVSSLSDDIINAVPQAMRDGSYGLGATRSETIRQVVLPAALPGIVGAILLAASRAIGETMIVVLGAGAAARLSLNPFEAMTTVTAKIVSQLTGDSDFASPEALVAFALGMTLFLMTLGLNVFALYIVRKYREQYD